MIAGFFLPVVMPDGTRIDNVAVQVQFDAYYQSVYLAGAMDSREPSESEMTISKVTVEHGYDDGEKKFEALGIEMQLIATQMDAIWNKCWEAFYEAREGSKLEYSED